MDQVLKEREFGDGVMKFQVLNAFDKEWMRIDDIIAWLKHDQGKGDNPLYHDLIKALVKMKNS